MNENISATPSGNV